MGLYLAVAFGMAWACWWLGWLVSHKRLDLPLVPILMLGSFGPLIGALVVTWTEGGPRHALSFFARALDPRMGWAVFLVSVLLLPAFAIAVELLHARLIHGPARFAMTLADLPLTYLFLFVLGGTLAEEYGWSLLSDKLDALLPLKSSALALGVVWAFWHLPLFFIIAPGLAQGYTPFHLFLVCTVSMRFLFAWAYHRGGYNILSNMLFHTASNLAYSVVALAPEPAEPSTDRLWMFTALVAASAVVLWIAAPLHPKTPPPEALASA